MQGSSSQRTATVLADRFIHTRKERVGVDGGAGGSAMRLNYSHHRNTVVCENQIKRATHTQHRLLVSMLLQPLKISLIL